MRLQTQYGILLTYGLYALGDIFFGDIFFGDIFSRNSSWSGRYIINQGGNVAEAFARAYRTKWAGEPQ